MHYLRRLYFTVRYTNLLYHRAAPLNYRRSVVIVTVVVVVVIFDVV